MADAGPDKTYYACCTCVQIGAAGGNCHPNGSLCAGSRVEYSWAPSTGLSSTTICNPCASPNTTTTYTLTVTFHCNADCCCDGCTKVGLGCGLGDCTGSVTRKDYVTVTYNAASGCCRLIDPKSETEKNSRNFNLYPNPNMGIFSVELDKIDENVSLYVYDIDGRSVWTRQNTTDKIVHINISNLPKGTYYVQGRTDGEVLFFKKIIFN